MTMLRFEDLPERIEDESALEELLSRPTPELVSDLGAVDGDILVLGVGGKVGPTLARMAKRAAPDKRVIGVARFSDAELRARIEGWGIETLTRDLLDPYQVAGLPDVQNVVYMAGKKFGAEGDKPFTWAMNTLVPALVAQRFRASRIVAFSTLCVYPFAPVLGPGCDETVPPGPPGDYANSCVGRERMFEYFSHWHGTPGRLVRLCYAIDLRYGVLFDVAKWVRDGTPIPLATGHANVIWQGDAVAQILRSFAHCTDPTTPLNIGGPGNVGIRWLAEEFGRRLGKAPQFEGSEADQAWVTDCSAAQRLFGHPVVPLPKMVDWVADWVRHDMAHYEKPTRYEVRDGRF